MCGVRATRARICSASFSYSEPFWKWFGCRRMSSWLGCDRVPSLLTRRARVSMLRKLGEKVTKQQAFRIQPVQGIILRARNQPGFAEIAIVGGDAADIDLLRRPISAVHQFF